MADTMHECPDRPGILAGNAGFIHCIVSGYRRAPFGMERRRGRVLPRAWEAVSTPWLRGLHFPTAPPLRLWLHPTGFESEGLFQGWPVLNILDWWTRKVLGWGGDRAAQTGGWTGRWGRGRQGLGRQQAQEVLPMAWVWEP